MWDAGLKQGPSGTSAIILVNTNGAFYNQQAKVGKDVPGVPPLLVPANVGPFQGGSLGAQIGLLIHEFAHSLNLIPSDKTSSDQSNQNMNTIFKNCLSAIQEAIKEF
jgi:hypothetical protein